MKKHRTIRLKNVYEAIDFVIYGTYGNRIQYDFVIHPGSDPARNRFRFEGAGDVYIAADGRLICSTPFCDIEQGRLIAWQADQFSRYINSRDIGSSSGDPVAGRIEAGFLLNGDGSISFSVGKYDPGKTMVLDSPVRSRGTYFGGTGYGDVMTLATDRENSVYPGGTTETTTGTAIATPGSHQPTFGGYYADAFLTKFTSNGTREWGTYSGGMNMELGSAVAVDPQGNVYLAGHTASFTGISMPGSHEPQFGGYEYCLGMHIS